MKDKYLEALVDVSNEDLTEKEWLIKYAELYKTTINQPEGLPAIPRSMIKKGSLKLKFHEAYNHFIK